MLKNITDFYEEAILRIGEGLTPEAFANMVYEYFHIPIIIVDEGYKLLAYANDGSFKDPYWEDIVHLGTARSETIANHYLKAGYLESIPEVEGAIYVDWGVSRDYPQSCGPIYVNKELEGFLSLLFMDPALKDEACRLNARLCRLFGILLQTMSYQKKTMRNPIRQVFARKFFDPENLNEPLDADSYRPYINISPDYRIAVIGTFDEGKKMSELLRGRIRSSYPNIIYLTKQRFLYVLFENQYDASDEIMEQKFTHILGTYMLHAGISQPFSSFKDRALYIEQAEAALHAGTWTSPEKTVYFYNDHYSSIMLMAAVTSMARENLIPAELDALRRYDEENESNYTETLFAYLYERNDLNRSAARLHIHRNTMHYRMEKICQLLHIDPDEPQTALRLEIGFGIERFLRTGTASFSAPLKRLYSDVGSGTVLFP